VIITFARLPAPLHRPIVEPSRSPRFLPPTLPRPRRGSPAGALCAGPGAQPRGLFGRRSKSSQRCRRAARRAVSTTPRPAAIPARLPAALSENTFLRKEKASRARRSGRPSGARGLTPSLVCRAGLMLFCHGCVHRATDFYDAGPGCPSCIGLPVERTLVAAALARGFVTVAVSSEGTCPALPPPHFLPRTVPETLRSATLQRRMSETHQGTRCQRRISGTPRGSGESATHAGACVHAGAAGAAGAGRSFCWAPDRDLPRVRAALSHVRAARGLPPALPLVVLGASSGKP